MRAWLSDLRAVVERGWWLIALISGTGLIGAGQQVGRTLFSHHHWQSPSPWWLLLVAVGFIVAQQMVIKDRRGGGRPDSAGSQEFAETFFEGIAAHSQGQLIPPDVEYRASLTQASGEKLELSVRQATVGLPPTLEAPVASPESLEAEDQTNQ